MWEKNTFARHVPPHPQSQEDHPKRKSQMVSSIGENVLLRCYLLNQCDQTTMFSSRCEFESIRCLVCVCVCVSGSFPEDFTGTQKKMFSGRPDPRNHLLPMSFICFSHRLFAHGVTRWRAGSHFLHTEASFASRQETTRSFYREPKFVVHQG